ncbi:YciI family protein [Phormidium yuhuli AB48]|uniref:YciI family protein n=1 Tax=Phormidium yuhuli AB48 TaxID=2940671 RepID=A0ABY5AQJ3_9CYAN|nr:YciI family protein [Phormidium yuhuli]USR91489.1 YciI family protein [Phormidium yuhuli AB48]
MAWFAKIESGIVDKSTFDHYVPAHIEYVKQLNQRGYQAKSGYWNRRGGGMLIFQAESMQEAEAIVQQDPLVLNRCVTYDLYEWCLVVED